MKNNDDSPFVIGSAMALTVMVFAASLLLIKVFWSWTIPDLFPGAVQAGLIAGTISWLTAVKIAFFVAIVSIFVPWGNK